MQEQNLPNIYHDWKSRVTEMSYNMQNLGLMRMQTEARLCHRKQSLARDFVVAHIMYKFRWPFGQRHKIGLYWSGPIWIFVWSVSFLREGTHMNYPGCIQLSWTSFGVFYRCVLGGVYTSIKLTKNNQRKLLQVFLKFSLWICGIYTLVLIMKLLKINNHKVG